MINNFADIKDFEIAKLKRRIAKLESVITDFKKYDEERKLYYADKMQRLGEFESYFQELEDTDTNTKLLNTIQKYKHQVKVLNIKLMYSKIDFDNISLNDMKVEVSKVELKRQNKELREEIKNLKSIRDQLLYKLSKKCE